MGRDERGRADRLRLLYDEHAAVVARYAARRTAASDVPDVVSETFLVAWRRLDAVPADAAPWLIATARGVLANRRRAALRGRALSARLTAESRRAPASHPAADVSEVDRRLLGAIGELPDAEREAFLLVAWDGLDGTRAARAAGCSGATFRMRLHRARRRLRGLIADPDLRTDAATTMEETS